MTRPRRKMPRNCDACGAPIRRGKSRPCSRNCGAWLHADRRSPCSDAHAPVCPNHQPHPEALEEPVTEPPDITDQDILNAAAAIDLFHADALIEDALNPKPLLDPETLDLIHAGLDSGEPWRVRATELLVDMYRLGMFAEKGGQND
ncbi:hypothetical protein ACFC1D_02205 [Streptomyces vinaceus]|uniref:hypothetical protein n=1 Tax=Streptomyces vinaceus TaxID=1960 RepID=UPI0035D6C9AC